MSHRRREQESGLTGENPSVLPRPRATTTARAAILATHDVDEAVYLADRIVLLSGKPAAVRDVFPVEILRPRDRGDARLAALRARILAALGRDATGNTLLPSTQ